MGPPEKKKKESSEREERERKRGKREKRHPPELEVSDEAPEYPQLESVMERIPELEEDDPPEEAWVVAAGGASAVVVVGLEKRREENKGREGRRVEGNERGGVRSVGRSVTLSKFKERDIERLTQPIRR